MSATGSATDLPEVLGGFDLTDQSRFAGGVPYEVFARLRAEAPVLFHPPGRSADGEGFWVLTRHADIVAAAAAPEFSAQGGPGRAGGGSHLEDLPMGVHAGVLFAMMDDPRHDEFKRMLAPAMTGVAVRSRELRLRTIAAGLVDSAVARGGADFVVDVSEPFALRAVALLLGAPSEDWDQLTGWVHGALGFVNRKTGEPDEFSAGIFHAMRKYFEQLLVRKLANPGADVASTIVRAATDGVGQPSRYEREANIVLLLITGLEQPRNTIAGGVLALARHPEQWWALRRDRSLLPGAIEEILRWCPPNPYNRRTATEDIVLHGKRIKAGDKVTLWWPSANRDEDVFRRPSAFDIRRTPNPHLSFGAGIHHCLGEEFGRLEIRVLLETLLDRVAEVRQAGSVVWAPNNKHTVPLEMPVELVPAGRDRKR
ncbi:cytochrome P450 [Amycolatopsis sp. NPDC088138]|uniref:cytochrome P450 n=1 Tax=Amycolatopsis sp. NPDC088138 TaxID=3363938 RepID=UPI003828CD23